MSLIEKIKILTRGKGRVALHNGYQYHFKKTYANQTTYWLCAKRKINHCVGTITVMVNKSIIN